MSVDIAPLVTKQIVNCPVGNVVQEGDVVEYQVKIVNRGQSVLDATICDALNSAWASVTWEDSLGNTGDVLTIEQVVAIPGRTEYTMDINAVAGPIDDCLDKTSTNLVEVKPTPTEDNPCPESYWARAETIYFGRCDPHVDPNNGIPGDRDALSLLMNFNEFEWYRFMDQINCEELSLEQGPLNNMTLQELCDTIIGKIPPILTEEQVCEIIESKIPDKCLVGTPFCAAVDGQVIQVVPVTTVTADGTETTVYYDTVTMTALDPQPDPAPTPVRDLCEEDEYSNSKWVEACFLPAGALVGQTVVLCLPPGNETPTYLGADNQEVTPDFGAGDVVTIGACAVPVTLTAESDPLPVCITRDDGTQVSALIHQVYTDGVPVAPPSYTDMDGNPVAVDGTDTVSWGACELPQRTCWHRIEGPIPITGDWVDSELDELTPQTDVDSRQLTLQGFIAGGRARATDFTGGATFDPAQGIIIPPGGSVSVTFDSPQGCDGWRGVSEIGGLEWIAPDGSLVDFSPAPFASRETIEPADGALTQFTAQDLDPALNPLTSFVGIDGSYTIANNAGNADDLILVSAYIQSFISRVYERIIQPDGTVTWVDPFFGVTLTELEDIIQLRPCDETSCGDAVAVAAGDGTPVVDDPVNYQTTFLDVTGGVPQTFTPNGDMTSWTVRNRNATSATIQVNGGQVLPLDAAESAGSTLQGHDTNDVLQDTIVVDPGDGAVRVSISRRL